MHPFGERRPSPSLDEGPQAMHGGCLRARVVARLQAHVGPPWWRLACKQKVGGAQNHPQLGILASGKVGASHVLERPGAPSGQDFFSLPLLLQLFDVLEMLVGVGNDGLRLAVSGLRCGAQGEAVEQIPDFKEPWQRHRFVEPNSGLVRLADFQAEVAGSVRLQAVAGVSKSGFLSTVGCLTKSAAKARNVSVVI